MTGGFLLIRPVIPGRVDQVPAEEFRGPQAQHGDFFGVDQHYYFLASMDLADTQVAQFPVVSQGDFPVLVDVLVAVPELAVAVTSI